LNLIKAEIQAITLDKKIGTNATTLLSQLIFILTLSKKTVAKETIMIHLFQLSLSVEKPSPYSIKILLIILKNDQ